MNLNSNTYIDYKTIDKYMSISMNIIKYCIMITLGYISFTKYVEFKANRDLLSYL